MVRRNPGRPPSFPFLVPREVVRVGRKGEEERDLQYYELPSRFILYDVRTALNVEEDEYLHSSVVLPESWGIPRRLVELSIIKTRIPSEESRH